jgi:hypothetical protein
VEQRLMESITIYKGVQEEAESSDDDIDYNTSDKPVFKKHRYESGESGVYSSTDSHLSSDRLIIPGLFNQRLPSPTSSSCSESFASDISNDQPLDMRVNQFSSASNTSCHTGAAVQSHREQFHSLYLLVDAALGVCSY